MEIFRDSVGYVIDLSNDEATDLKTACETPEYHLPILTKIAQELARLEKEPVVEYDTSGGASDPTGEVGAALTNEILDSALEALVPKGYVVVPDSEDDAHYEPAPETETVIKLTRQHGHAVGGANVPDRYALYFFEDGSSFYIYPDGSYSEELIEGPKTEPASGPRDPLLDLLVDQATENDTTGAPEADAPKKRGRPRKDITDGAAGTA